MGLAAFLSELIWPIIFLVTIGLFRKPIGDAIGRLANFRFEAGKVKIYTVLRGQVSEPVMRQVMGDPKRLLAPQRLEVTVLLCAFRGGTQLVETGDVQALTLIRAYQTALADIVRAADGLVESMEPERMVAAWGAPVPSNTHADDACDTAIKLLHVSERVHDELSDSMRFKPHIQIVITSAIVLAGPMGPERLPRYSILGDYGFQLNRLEAIARDLGLPVLVTSLTARKLLHPRHLHLVREGITVIGKKEPVDLYALDG